MTLLDTIVVVIYLGLVILVGLYFARRQTSTDQYFLGGRNMPGWVVGLSLVGTMIGTATFIGHPGEVFRTDMWNLPMMLMLLPAMAFIGRYIVTFYRRVVRLSVYSYLEQRFGYSARVYGGLAFIFNRFINIITTFYFLSLAITILTDWDIWWTILLVGVFSIVYTLVGGVAAMIWVDVAQGIALASGGLVCLFITLLRPAAGPVAVISTAWQGGKLGWGEWRFSWTEDNIWIFLILGLIWGVQRFATDQNVVQRYLIARSDREARKAAYLGAVSCVPVWVLFMFIGACLWAFYQLSPEALPQGASGDKTAIMALFLKTELPHGMFAFIVAALTASAMSSMDADLNSAAAIVVDDYYSRLRPAASDRQRLTMGRLVVCVLGGISIFGAQQWIGVESAIGFMTELISVAAAGVLGLFVLGALSHRATARGAMAGIIVCVLFTAWATFTSIRMPALDNHTLLDLGSWNYGLNPKLIGVFSNLILLVVGLIASSLLGGPRPNRTHLTVWSNRGTIHAAADEPE